MGSLVSRAEMCGPNPRNLNMGRREKPQPSQMKALVGPCCVISIPIVGPARKVGPVGNAPRMPWLISEEYQNGGTRVSSRTFSCKCFDKGVDITCVVVRGERDPNASATCTAHNIVTTKSFVRV